MTINHKFVEYIPDEIGDGTLYISLAYRTVIHKCFCGCGMEVVTPLSPTDWRITFDGETISLYPSIGNWSYPCRSHYSLKSSEIIWANSWSTGRIQAARVRDKQAKRDYFDSLGSKNIPEHKETHVSTVLQEKMGILGRIRCLVRKLF
jgi:hypothetical protein